VSPVRLRPRPAPVWCSRMAPWRRKGAVYHAWGGPGVTSCGRLLQHLSLHLPHDIAASFARPCKRCYAWR
jgi:hypothetical protein